MESKKNELYGKVFQFVPNHKLIKKGDLVIENNINYEYKGKSVDGMAVLLREDGELCFTRYGNLDKNYSFKEPQIIAERFLKTVKHV